MDQTELLKKIHEVFSKVLEHENFELNEETSAHDVDGWDSLSHMVIITEIENTFNIKFKLTDLMDLKNVGDLLKLLKSHAKF